MKKCFTILLASVALMLALPAAAQYNVVFKDLDLTNLTKGSSFFSDVSGGDWEFSRCRLEKSDVFSIGTTSKDAATYTLTDEALATAWKAADTTSSEATQVFSAILTKELTGIVTLKASYEGAYGGIVSAYMFAKAAGSSGYTFLASAQVAQSDEGEIKFQYSSPQNLSAVAIVVRPGTLTSVSKSRSLKLVEFKAELAQTKNEKPVFSLAKSDVSVVMAGTKVQISAPAGATNAKVHYTVNGGAEVVVPAPAQLVIDTDMEISAYVSSDEFATGEVATAAYTLFDVNANFAVADDGSVKSWNGGTIKNDEYSKAESDGNGTVILTQKSNGNKRFRTVRFWALPGEYAVSASAVLGGANVSDTSKLELEYTKGYTSNSYNKLDTITGTTSGTLSGTFKLDEPEVITISFCVAKVANGEEVTATISNFSFSHAAPTAVRSAEVAQLRAWTDGGVVRVCAEPGSKVEVFDISGRCVATTVADAEVCSLSGLPVGQMLVVRCGGKTSKIVVR